MTDSVTRSRASFARLLPGLLRVAGICTAVYALIAACFFLLLRLSFGEAFALPGAGMARFGLTCIG